MLRNGSCDVIGAKLSTRKSWYDICARANVLFHKKLHDGDNYCPKSCGDFSPSCKAAIIYYFVQFIVLYAL